MGVGEEEQEQVRRGSMKVELTYTSDQSRGRQPFSIRDESIVCVSGGGGIEFQ